MQKPREVLVFKLSGSLFFSSEFDRVVKVLSSRTSGKLLILVAGGGDAARKYIEAGRKIGADQSSLDEIGIAISRLNATVMKEAFGKLAVDSLPRTLSDVADALEDIRSSPKRRIVVCGGLHPGQSTNAVAALIAEKARALRLINATDVDFVYDRDPKKFKNARKLKSVSVTQLEKILGSESVQAGAYDLMDPVALKIIARSRIPTTIVKCESKSLEMAISGRARGTKITF